MPSEGAAMLVHQVLPQRMGKPLGLLRTINFNDGTVRVSIVVASTRLGAKGVKPARPEASS
eukprot:3331464-Pyramimonas_sp.AAC.2